MKPSVVAFACVVVLLTVVHSASAAKCQNIPLRVTLYTNAVVNPSTGATTPAAITSDGGGGTRGRTSWSAPAPTML